MAKATKAGKAAQHSRSVPTIHDVARAAGVTIGTASQALNGRGKMRPETRARIQEAAALLEYRPIDVGRAAVPVLYAFAQVTDRQALCLIPDDAQGGRLATEHLLRAGRRRLAHVTGPRHFECVRSRQEGMEQALREHGLDLPAHR